MEPTQKEPSTNREYHDVDLGFILYKAGKALNRFGGFIWEFFFAIFQTTIIGLIFLRNNFIWLLLGGAVGLGYGYITNMGRGVKYFSVSTVRMNFGSTRALYNTIDYVNSLKEQGKINELSEIFKIPAQDAGAIVSFEATPVINDMIVSELYKDAFTRFKRNDLIRQDTFWTRVIKFEDFKKSLNKLDYPVHEIKAVCTNPDIFSRLQQGLVDLLAKNPVLVRNRDLQQKAILTQKDLLENSLKELDTLSRTYNKKLLREEPVKEGGFTNITLSDRSMLKTPELDLYSTRLTLRDELSAVQTRLANDQDIMQVSSPFNPVGQRQGVYNQSYFKTGIYGFFLVFFFLLSLRFFKMLGKIDTTTFVKQKIRD